MGNEHGSRAGDQPSNVHRKRAERRPEIVKRRREQRRREFEKQQRNWLILRMVAGVVLVAIVVAIAWWGYQQWEEYQVSQDVEVFFGIDDYAADHVEGEVLYEQVPPVGGPHNNIWQNCGFYDEPIYNWHGVHSLEHGAVWITYDPDLPEEDIEQLRDLGNQTYVLVSPYPGLEHPVVASVWGKQIALEGVGDERLRPFIREYRTNPDNTPEPGALCSLGVDYTIDDGFSVQSVPAEVSGVAETDAEADEPEAISDQPEVDESTRDRVVASPEAAAEE
ncbi:MAG TPA: DUF3105 domain-containing protein [Thermomicrobiales bacterium]|nr:DUF3105 domain-containing protein [Thermomicrobiales bacterium]